MDLTKDQLLSIKYKYVEKQNYFYIAYLFQHSCLKKIKELDVDSDVLTISPSTVYVKMLNKKFIRAYSRLKLINVFLKTAKTSEQLAYFIKLFKIDEIDKDLPHAFRLSKRFYDLYKDKGYVPKESLENLEKSNRIICGIYKESIEQLQCCIDVIDKSLELSNANDLQK